MLLSPCSLCVVDPYDETEAKQGMPKHGVPSSQNVPPQVQSFCCVSATAISTPKECQVSACKYYNKMGFESSSFNVLTVNWPTVIVN